MIQNIRDKKESEMKKIVDYKVVRYFNNTNTFSEIVCDAIKEGWQPYGEVIVDRVEECGTYYIQAMVKYAEE